MKVLILGASGFIGSYLARALVGCAEVLGTYRQHKPVTLSVPLVSLDLTDGEAVKALVRDFRPENVIHLVAQAVVEDAAAQHETAWQVNVTGTGNVVTACCEAGAKLVFLSTDYVFDGIAGPYAEEAACNPVNAYGRVKLAGEEIMRQSVLSHLIVRTSLVYGWPAYHQHSNFVATLIHQLRQGRPFTAYTDMVRIPIYVGDLVGVLGQLMEQQAEGLYHIGSSNVVNMYEFALNICDVFGFDRGLIVVATSDGQGDIPRPKRCGLRTEKAVRDFGIRFPTTLEGLHRMKEEEPSYD